MRSWFFLLLSVTLAGCQSFGKEQHLLQWQFTNGKAHKYEMVYAEIPVDSSLSKTGFEVLNNTSLRAQVKHALAKLDLPQAGYQAKVEPHSPYIRISIVGVQPDFENPPADRQEEYDRAIMQANAGNIVLLGDYSSNGQLLSFFLEPSQKSLSNLLFALPNQPVSSGDSWPLEVYGLEMSPGFIPDNAHRLASGHLDGVTTDSQGRKIAELFYLIAESVSGHFRLTQGEEIEKLPVDVELSYFAHAHFLVDEGRWLNFKAVRLHTSTGTDRNTSAMVYTLHPLPFE